jgi:cysteinyl-tRNA synthetase
METGARIHPGEKKNDPLDFALWKKAKEGEPSWDSPWGKGRPGWHIECSVMSSDILGDEFDIHGGGLDLIFPHHENEIAQSEGAGKKFARYWIHHGLLTINGQKMAKSLGNFITVKDFLSRYDADVLKFFFLQAHYSQPVDFTWEKIAEKQKALKRVITVLESIKHIEAGKEFIVKTDLKQKISQKELMEAVEQAHRDFKKAMDDDFNTPNAVAVLFEIVRSCDKILYDVGYTDDYLPVLIKAKQAIEEFGNIFGLSFKVIPLSKREEDIKRLIDIRLSLKNQKLFAEADKIRKELEEEGIILEDTKDGKTIWRSK